jgi:glycopeptide antibiotics resistance protein
MIRRWATALTVVYLLVFLGLTLGGFYHPGAPRNLVPFRTMEHDFRKGGWEFLVNFVGNVVVTLPIGWFLPYFLGQKCSVIKVGGFAMVLSAIIEVLQGISGKRVADIDDVILNTTGALIGYALWSGVERVVRWARRDRNSVVD